MARIFKNKTGSQVEIPCGSHTQYIPAGEQFDLATIWTLDQLRSCEALIELLGQGTSLYALDDGTGELTVTAAIDLIRNIYPTELNIKTAQETSDGTPIFAARSLNLGSLNFLRIDNGSEQMAVDGRSTQAEDVWDGTGVSDTGTDWTRGGIGSESAGSKHSGTNGLDTGVAALNDVAYFDYGSDRNIPSLFDSVSFWMNPQAFPVGSKLQCAWSASGSSTIVGNLVRVDQSVPNMDLGVWQRVTIPVVDFNLTSNVGRLNFRFAGAAGQKFYLDDIDMLNSTGDGPYRFRVTGVSGKNLHVSRITLAMACGNTGWNSTAFANIVGGLELGVLLRMGVISTEEVLWTLAVKNNMDLFGRMPIVEDFSFADDELMLTFTLRPENASIILTPDNAMEFVVRDDLSTLSNMRAYLQYGEEVL